tara:strand:- start:470 stop:661 length:192 start_codon:yes stop_codon:yes gene_type:complete
MNMAIERIIRDIYRVKDNNSNKSNVSKSPKVKPLKEKTTEAIKTIKKNNSTDNFMKFQWSWTL